MAKYDQSATGVIDVIRRDHREIEEMLAEVEGANGQSREEAFAALAQKLKAHETAEQEVVHPVTDDVGAPDVADSVEKEESKASSLLASMEGLDVTSAEFEAKFQELKAGVMAHAQHEEAEEHPRIMESESAETLAELGRDFESVESAAMDDK